MVEPIVSCLVGWSIGTEVWVLAFYDVNLMFVDEGRRELDGLFFCLCDLDLVLVDDDGACLFLIFILVFFFSCCLQLPTYACKWCSHQHNNRVT